MEKKLLELEKQTAQLKAVIGFDGYIDELCRVVAQGDSAKGYVFYQDISSFAARLADAAGKSADLEIVPIEVKLGGNAPIMANALAQLGVNATCIGAMGYPKLQEVFSEMAKKCTCISLCDPAYTHAFEFSDGKLMFANARSLELLNWDRIKKLMGLEQLRELFGSADLIALVNWSGIAGASDIWAGVYKEVLPGLEGTRKKFFFDLADPSKKSGEEINAVLDQIRAYAAYGQVFLGLNENEAIKIHSAIGGRSNDLNVIARNLYEQLKISAVIIHPIDRCIAATEEGVFTEYGTVVEKPCISTGGGDNFNAGFCLGQMLGWDLKDSMVLGMRTSGFYVGNGYSPSLAQLKKVQR